jgi:hypothetical protein
MQTFLEGLELYQKYVDEKVYEKEATLHTVRGLAGGSTVNAISVQGI